MSSSEVQLYSYFRSSASYRVRIGLELKKIAYKYVSVHLVKDGGEQLKPEFLKLNPMAEVPCLVHKGQVISQSMAILSYLDDVFDGPRLFPLEPLKRAHVIQICETVNSGIHPVQNLKVLQEISRRFSTSSETKAQWAHDWIQRGFKGLEELLKRTAGSYCFGGEVTAADLFVVPQAYNARRFSVDMSQFPTIERIEQECLKLTAFQKAEPGKQPDAPTS